MLPSRPDLSGPISLAIVNDEFAYVACFGSDVEATYVSLGIEAVSDEGIVEASLLTGENADRDAITITHGQILIPSAPPQGLDVFEQERVDLNDVLKASVKAYISISGPDVLVEMAFEDVDISELRQGRFQYHSGEISDKPCEMGD